MMAGHHQTTEELSKPQTQQGQGSAEAAKASRGGKECDTY